MKYIVKGFTEGSYNFKLYLKVNDFQHFKQIPDMVESLQFLKRTLNTCPILPAHAGNMGTLVMTSTFEYCRQGGW